MRRRAIIHIGPQKTATSTIQTALSQSRPALAKAGILYPGRRRDHTATVAAWLLDNPKNDFLVRLKSEGDDRPGDAEDALAELDREVGQVPWQTLVLSAEVLSSLNQTSIAQLKAWLDRHVQSCQIVYTTRDPVAWAVSVAQQMCKSTAEVAVALGSPRQAKWRETIERYEAVFGADALTVVTFEDMVADPDGPTAFLLKTAGLDDAVARLNDGPMRRNAALSWEAAMMMADLNARRPFVGPEGRNPHRTGRELSAFVGLEGQPFDLSDAVRRRAYDESRPDVAWLRSRFGIDRYDYPAEQLRPSQNPSGISPQFWRAVVDRLADQANELLATRRLLVIERMRARGRVEAAEKLRLRSGMKFPTDNRFAEPSVQSSGRRIPQERDGRAAGRGTESVEAPVGR